MKNNIFSKSSLKGLKSLVHPLLFVVKDVKDLILILRDNLYPYILFRFRHVDV